jgi:cell shape-determining protein MreD
MIIRAIVIISLFLDGYLSFFLPINGFSLFMPLCTLTSLIICYPFIDKKYLFAFIIGCIYDLMYTNMLVLSGSIFIIIYFLLSRINNITKIKMLDNLIKLILMIIIYRLIFSLFTCILFIKEINFSNIIINILCSIIFNVFYSIILSCFLKNKSK